MCRNIRPLFNFEPHVTDDEVRAAAVQYGSLDEEPDLDALLP